MKFEQDLVSFVGGYDGMWSVERVVLVTGDSVSPAQRVAIFQGPDVDARPPAAAWILRGTTQPDRYLKPLERKALDTVSPPLARMESTAAALIPIRKSAAWWALSAGERRAIFEERSHHLALSLPYLPRIARRLHHCRDLGEPFDFLTWFEYAPKDEPAFDDLVGALRRTEEWRYVEREVDIRLRRDGDM